MRLLSLVLPGLFLGIACGQTCDNGLPGVSQGEVCCVLECGDECGGVGCSSRGGGLDGGDCCTKNILDSGVECAVSGVAPCFGPAPEVEPPTPTPPTPTPPTPAPVPPVGGGFSCSGDAGILAGDVCCAAECGACGGVGCSGRPGGEESCCTSAINDANEACSAKGSAPCIVDDDNTDPTETTCIAGVPGILVSDVCCPNSCGSCAGAGCPGRDGGPDFSGQQACCGGGVRSLGRTCSADVGAPCVVADDPPAPTPAPVVEEETCIAGVPGILVSDVCCPTSCGSCAGVGCGGRDGGDNFTGSEACCGGGVRALGRTCSADVGAPCVVSDDPPAPPTPAPIPDGPINACLDLSNSRCTFEGGIELNLSNCGITDADAESGALKACFENFGESNILFLELDLNALTTLPAGILDGLEALIRLDLEANELTTLPAGIFDNVPTMEVLYLDTNKITALPAGIFDNLVALQTLHLDDNELTTLPEGIFDSLTALTRLYMEGNSLTMLNDGMFDSLAALELLQIQANALTEIPAGVFDNLAVLDNLRLDNNSLDTLPDGIFDNLVALTQLFLAFNDFTTLPAGIFDSLANLTNLFLDSNDLISLPAGIFDGLVALETLGLDFNDLTTLPPGIFDNQGALVELFLNQNDLTTLPVGIFDNLVSLDTLWLTDTPDLGCLPSVPSSETDIRREDPIGTECGCDFGDLPSPCGQGNQCTPGPVGYICGDDVEPPAPTPAPATDGDQLCMAGVSGILSNDICCPLSCGSCSGVGCSARDGGEFTGGEACCQSGVESLGRTCSADVGAPCVVA